MSSTCCVMSPPRGRLAVTWSAVLCWIEAVWLHALHSHNNTVQRWRRCHLPYESAEEYSKNCVSCKDQVTKSHWPTAMSWTSFVKIRRVSVHCVSANVSEVSTLTAITVAPGAHGLALANPITLEWLLTFFWLYLKVNVTFRLFQGVRIEHIPNITPGSCRG